MTTRTAVLVFSSLILACSQGTSAGAQAPARPANVDTAERCSNLESHQQPLGVDEFESEVLQPFVRRNGRVRYAALRNSQSGRAALNRFVEQVGAREIADCWTRNEKLAFYINAYNALVLKAVVDAWPMQSVMRVDGFFDGTRYRVAGRRMTLNDLENNIIRRHFREKRIHFVVNCASRGCPRLRPQAMRPETIRRTMRQAAREFVRANTEIEENGVALSSIFDWFADDFGGRDGVIEFVASQLPEAQREAFRAAAAQNVRFTDYNWDINAAN